MSIQSEIERINGNVASAYSVLSAKGATMPSERNTANLASAIESIPINAEAMSIETIWEICGYEPNGGLPDGYTLLEYIQSSGTQYIDTGFKPKYNTRVVMDVQISGTSAQMLFGARDENSKTAKNQFLLYRTSATAVRSDYFGTNVSATISNTTVRTTIDRNANVTTLFGTTITNTAVSSGECSYPLYLFNANNAGAVLSAYAVMKLYSCQIYDNGTLIRDFAPCTNASGEYGLYDKANGVFYGNAGSGSFTGA